MILRDHRTIDSPFGGQQYFLFSSRHHIRNARTLSVFVPGFRYLSNEPCAP